MTDIPSKIFNILASASRIEKKLYHLDKIKQIIFDNNGLYFKKPHKFIIPVSLDRKTGAIPFNFAFTDLAEKSNFILKVKRIIGALDSYHSPTFLKWLNLFYSIEVERKVFGILCSSNSAEPCIKLQLCELQGMKLEEKIKLLELCAACFNLQIKDILRFTDLRNLSIVGIDFTGDNQYEIKLYFLYRGGESVDVPEPMLNKKLTLFAKDWNERLNNENEHFMLMLRFNSYFEIKSVKYYRFFEGRAIDNLLALYLFQTLVGGKNYLIPHRFIQALRRSMLTRRICLMPSLLGVDIPFGWNEPKKRINKSDIYFTFKKENPL